LPSSSSSCSVFLVRCSERNFHSGAIGNRHHADHLFEHLAEVVTMQLGGISEDGAKFIMVNR
jgi:hypothetical protein